MTTNKIVLITGANKGIGFAAARELGRRGHTVLLGARDETRGQAAADTLAGEGLDVRFVRLDVTDPGSAEAAARLIEVEHGRLDILINNAGITRPHPSPPTAQSLDDLRAIYETNVFGVVTVTNAMLPLLRRGREAVIGNVTSGLGAISFLSAPDEELRPYAHLIGYNSSKAALNAVTLIFADELRGEGIRVNALSPGFCATDLNHHRGRDSAAEGGARIARAALEETRTGVFCDENGGVYPW
ncbi:SDR family NAD(P)-dependent oxidoreductase [Actinomadura atramentaria]|uniref:SDR family NAD(P)-dependent oxidoreductase n=1 Tax=Actinomadura atramentaria TaxID=1990 RepID=UPI000369477C|nr:SDR family NAD(P)-dependent oxidoreductase [Actinomadura atramentaria]